jgi:sulfate transport system permease protein
MLYSPDGWIGSIFARAGIQISYTTVGITIAMVFVGIPFVVRTIQPVLEKLDPQYEQAAEILGASKTRTFVKIILPEIVPVALIGFGLAFARSIGEFGSVMFISGNMPFQTQVVSMEIVSRLEQHQHHASASIALVMLVFSFAVLLAINILQAKINKIAKGES